MDTRISGWKCRAALALCLAFGLSGCAVVYTVHSIAAPSHEPSTVPDVSGLWMLRDDPWPSEVLSVTALEYDVGQCRDATIQSLGPIPSTDDIVADQICFVPVAGQLVLQLRTVGTVQLYQHYLVRLDQESVSFCGTVWSDLVEWSEDHPGGTAAHGLVFTRFGVGESTDLMIISPRSALLSYLEARLPAAVKVCDKVDEEGDSNWVTYIRLTPPRQPDAAGAAEEPVAPRN